MAEENNTVLTPATESVAPIAKAAKSKAKKRSVPSGQMHIQSTFNNTIITFTDKKGACLASSSAGACGFRGSKKGTAYAAQVAAEKAAEIAKGTFGMNSVDVFVKGIGLGRDSAIRAVNSFGMSITSIKDVTSIPHGGVRPKGQRKP
jgi:30S ribosomal protein S11